MRLISRFLKDESGATAIEYGLIAAGISVAWMAIKSHAANMPLLSGPLRKLVLSFSPAMLVGALYSIKAISGVQRPAIASIVPKLNGSLHPLGVL